MNLVDKILLGGFLKGYRTYLLAGGLVVSVVIQYLVGDVGLVDAIKNNWLELATAFGLYTAAQH